MPSWRAIRNLTAAVEATCRNEFVEGSGRSTSCNGPRVIAVVSQLQVCLTLEVKEIRYETPTGNLRLGLGIKARSTSVKIGEALRCQYLVAVVISAVDALLVAGILPWDQLSSTPSRSCAHAGRGNRCSASNIEPDGCSASRGSRRYRVSPLIVLVSYPVTVI
ncbi:hypothetical protein BDU57DRAFT_245230 [Ampelomyces quisqualis]|uniref:Uncharacterized protein n=1 Tax=Ampelomyces quisqualis TaxID=50730 RepID=A0A6A5QS67_AMPQU|nr:hypothetical protein BDU57DRAFT_245230 [Ampelomyces quisqualis]